MEFCQDDVVQTRVGRDTHNGETRIGAGSVGFVTVVGVELEDGSINGVEVLFEGRLYGYYRPTELIKIGRYASTHPLVHHSTDEKPIVPEDRPEMLMPDGFAPQAEAIALVQSLHYGPNSEFPLEVGDIYVVWFCKTLQNWKAMISTNAKDDAYYEVTHNGDKNETYVDRYIKESNTVVRRNDEVFDMTIVNLFRKP